MDVLANDGDLVKKVEFNMSALTPSKYVSNCPIKAPGSNGNRWRFQTRQQTYGPVTVKIAVIGRGGTVFRKDYRLVLMPGGSESNMYTFQEYHPNAPLTPVKMANVDFGIELELSTSEYVEPADVANSIMTNAGGSVDVRDMTHSYVAARVTSHFWKVMADSSLQCSVGTPNCNTFELVSPILSGGDGLGEVDRVIRAVGNISTIKVNSSMGFHVHVNVSELGLSELTNVCLNFIKYEAALDSLVPPSRRNNTYCRSNRSAIGGTNQTMMHILLACNSVEELGNTVSPSKHYKLNLQPLVSGRQPTIEFRLHSSSYKKEKVMNWVRFCVAFVYNSAKLKTPSYISRSNVDTDELFEMMMMYVIKDRYLRDFYRQRRVDVSNQSSCCDGCANGGGCVGKREVYRVSGFRMSTPR